MRRKKKKLVLIHSHEHATVVIIWVSPGGEVQRKVSPWKRPATGAAIQEWMDEYLERLNDGYQPAGFEVAPRPHCARVMIRQACVAEWNRPLTIEELKRMDQRQAAS